MSPSPTASDRRPASALPVAWSAIDLSSRHALQFLTSLVLARLLAPEDFGAIVLLQALLAAIAILVDGGLSTALIQHRDPSRTDESTAFWSQLAIASAAAAGLWSGLPWVARFLEVPQLSPLGAAGAVVVIANALGSIHVILLTRRLDFLTQFKAGTVAALLSAATAVALALRGAGVWALAAQVATFAVVFTAMLWWLHRWRPLPRWSRASARSLFGFGGFILLANVINTIFERASAALIGKSYGARALGYYHRADTTQQLPTGLLGAILTRTLLPMLARAREDESSLRALTATAIRGAMFVNVPMMLGLAALALPALEALYGPRWRPAAPILEVLCIAGVFWPMHLINLNVLIAQGHARLMLRIEVVKKLIGLAMLLFGARYGVIGLAYALALFSVIGLAINTHYSGRLLRYGLLAQLRDIAPILLAAAPMVAVVHLASRTSAWPPLLLLPLLVLGGAIMFLVTAHVLRLQVLAEALRLLSGLREAARAPAPAALRAPLLGADDTTH